MWGTAWDKSIIFCIILLPPAGFGSCANILFMNKMFPLSYHIMCFLVFSPLQQCLLMSCCVRSRPNWTRLGRSLSSMSILPTSDLTATHQRSANTRSASTRRSCVLLYGVHHALSDIFPFFLLQLPFNSSSDEKKNSWVNQIHTRLVFHVCGRLGVNLLVGTENGLMLLDRSGQGKVYNLITRRRFQQMEVLEGLNVLVTISGLSQYKKSLIFHCHILQSDGITFLSTR